MDNLFKNQFRIPSARLQTWDYSSEGAYYITICVGGGVHSLGRVNDGEMIPSEVGRIAQNFWMEIPQHFPFVILDEFVVMPNHVHGILIVDMMDDRNNGEKQCNGIPPVEKLPVETFQIAMLPGDSQIETLQCDLEVETLQCNVSTPPQPQAQPKNAAMSAISPKSGSLAAIIRSYKSAVTRQTRAINPSFGWQPRFYDHIIRNAEEFDRIRDYIHSNPSRWHEDKYYK